MHLLTRTLALATMLGFLAGGSALAANVTQVPKTQGPMKGFVPHQKGKGKGFVMVNGQTKKQFAANAAKKLPKSKNTQSNK